jgi:Tol biopolymer transport system component
MKKSLFYILFIISLVFNSCTSFQDFSLDSETVHSDILVYSINLVEPSQTMLYDPVRNVHTQILPDWDIGTFSLNINNRLAFSAPREGNNKIYVLDYPFTDNIPIEITPDTSSENYPLAWSPDGNYLLFSSVKDNIKKLLLWDGKNSFVIYNYHEAVYEFAWSLNGQLAFTDFYTSVFTQDYQGDSSEVFIWDGSRTISVSQNPSGYDRYPAWSKDGQLAFLSERNRKYDIYIWDGTSKAKGIPDINTFINVAPNLEHSSNGLIWTPSGTLAFSAIQDGDSHAQIYEWDGRTITNISQNPLSDNGAQSWRNDGYWVFITPVSPKNNDIVIRDETNRTILTTNGYYAPVWSPNGLLMFCTTDPSGWVLSIWNGSEVIEIAHADFISAKWQNGAEVVCSFA